MCSLVLQMMFYLLDTENIFDQLRVLIVCNF